VFSECWWVGQRFGECCVCGWADAVCGVHVVFDIIRFDVA
jgi:hypothetical protein